MYCLIVCLHMYCRSKSNNQDGIVEIPLTGLTLHNCMPVPGQDLDFQRHLELYFFLFNVRVRGVVRFVDIGGIVEMF